MENLLKFITEHSDCDTSRLILDRRKYPEIDMDVAVNSIESRRKLNGKVQEWHDEPRLVFPLKLSAEQCSSSATAQYKAELAENIILRCPDATKADCHFERPKGVEKFPEWTIADLTGGLGVDSWFFSQRAAKVTYNEMQPVLCDAATHNFKVLGAGNIRITNFKAGPENLGEIIDKGTDIVYMDPARRGEGGRKVFLIEDCTPDVLTLKDKIFEYTRHILIKLSPMADISMVCDRLGGTCREVHVVSAGGECKELLIWMDREWSGEYTIIATELHADSPASTFIFKPSEEKSSHHTPAYSTDIKALRQNAAYLFEPGKSLMKAGAFNLISDRFAIAKLGKSTHYYLTDSPETAQVLKAYGKVFKILECCPLDKRSIREMGKKYPRAEVTARNIPMDTATLKKKTGVTSGDDIHLFGLKSDSTGNMLMAATRI